MLLFPGSILSHRPNNPAKATSTIQIDEASAGILPNNPFVERDQNGEYLNFDILIKNTGTHTLYLATIEATVMDASVKPVFRQAINVNSQGTGLKAIGNTTLKPGQTIDIFNPFYAYPPDVKITFLQYQFDFDYADLPKQRDNNKKRLSTDFDLSLKKIITPKAYLPKNSYRLPLKGKLVVMDGRSFYPGQSIGPAGVAEQSVKGVALKSNRYAFDLGSADDNGNLFKNDPFVKENWYAFGQAVYAPATGIVVDLQNTLPDNDFKGKALKFAREASDADPNHLGNYVIIDQGNGEFCMLQHLEQGSLLVRIGQLVHQGEQLGKIGFSGDITFPHLHYRLMNNAKPLTADGIPGYFDNYKRYSGRSFTDLKRGRIESGDIVETDR